MPNRAGCLLNHKGGVVSRGRRNCLKTFRASRTATSNAVAKVVRTHNLDLKPIQFTLSEVARLAYFTGKGLSHCGTARGRTGVAEGHENPNIP